LAVVLLFFDGVSIFFTVSSPQKEPIRMRSCRAYFLHRFSAKAKIFYSAF